jgi:hypothetical protein
VLLDAITLGISSLTWEYDSFAYAERYDKAAGRYRPLPASVHAVNTQKSAARARAIVMEIERGLGFEPVDREFEHVGYDIESRDPATGRLRFIEVKGRVASARTITITKNEILYSLNKPEQYILALVEFFDDGSHRVSYIRQPFQQEPEFGVTSVNYDSAELLKRATDPLLERPGAAGSAAGQEGR